MAPPKKPRSVQLRARLKAVEAELAARLKAAEAELAETVQSEHEEILQTLGEHEQAYIEATERFTEVSERRREYIKKVLAMPAGQRPPVAKMTAATGLSKARLYQVRDGK